MKSHFRRFRKCRCLSICFLALIFTTPMALPAGQGPKAPKLKVMTRNLYLGADIFKVVDAAQNDLGSVPYAVADVYNKMLYTNFWARAEAIADEIEYADPDIVGLQEVPTFLKQTPGDFFDGNTYPASDIVIDFYTVLNNALKARGLHYDEYTVTNSDVELPMFDPSSLTYFSDVRLIDHDAILVRKDHNAVQIAADNYVTSVGQDFGSFSIEFIRGFVVVDADIKNTTYRIVNTHLEVAGDTDSILRVVQSAQMQELLLTLDYLDGEIGSEPVVMTGDFNSSPEDAPRYIDYPGYGSVLSVPPYLLATDPFYMQAIYSNYSGKEYMDTWILQDNPNKPIYDEGYTSGFEELINDPNDTLETRIDHIFLEPYNLELEKSRGEVVGDKATDMVPNSNDPGHYLWPSDHAGVVTNLKFEKP